MTAQIEQPDLANEENLLPEDDRRENNGKNERKSDGFFIILCVLAVNSFTFLTGCGYSWTSPVFLKLYSNDTNINPLGQPVTKLQESIIAGIPFLGSLIAPLFLSTLTHALGRKKLLTIFGGTQMLSYLLLIIDSNIWIYYIARFLFGLGFGIAMPVVTIYITEISPSHNRGRYGSMVGVFVPVGNLCSYVVGPLFSVRMFSLICALPCLIAYPFFLWFVPDSPTSLVTRGKVQKAEVVLQKLRNSEQVEEELNDILSMAKKHQHMEAEKVNLKNLLNDRVSLAGLKIALGICAIQIFSGIGIIMAFVGPIFQTVNADISGNTIAILVGVVKLLSFSTTSAVIDRFKRRTLLMYSTICASICLFVLGVYFYLKDSKLVSNIDQFSWLPVGCILLFIVFYATGIGPISHVLFGELFPGHFKAMAIAVISIAYTVITFLVTFSFRFATFYLGTHAVFWIFSAACCLGTFFIYFKVPETRGKTLLEIQHMLEKLHN